MSGFKGFLLRGNLVDLAIGIVIGVAFGVVITALVKDLITPLIAASRSRPRRRLLRGPLRRSRRRCANADLTTPICASSSHEAVDRDPRCHQAVRPRPGRRPEPPDHRRRRAARSSRAPIQAKALSR